MAIDNRIGPILLPSYPLTYKDFLSYCVNDEDLVSADADVADAA